MYVFFYCIFAQFMQFPVLDFGLVHSGSWPFNLPLEAVNCTTLPTYYLGYTVISAVGYLCIIAFMHKLS